LNIENLKTKNILYVEDDISIVTSFLPILNKLFKTVLVANNGLEGLELFKANDNINFVITDIKMPKMDGLEMAREIKKINPNMPCIITTAHGELDYFMQADEIGVYRYIQKPLNINEIIEAIDNFEDGLEVKKTDL